MQATDGRHPLRALAAAALAAAAAVLRCCMPPSPIQWNLHTHLTIKTAIWTPLHLKACS